jgi:phenylacetate-CoA ligase
MPTSPTAYFNFLALLRNQHKAPDSVHKIQKKKLKQLLEHAYVNVPFYRQRFQTAGLVLKELAGPEDLPKLPVTSKSDLQARPVEDTVSRTVDRQTCKVFATSGTTGIPITTYFSPYDSTLKNLGWLRAFWNTGMRPWQRTASLIGQKQIEERKSWYEYLGLWRRREISAWSDTQVWLDTLKQWKPHALLGYVMTLKILAEAMQRNEYGKVKPKFLFHSSAILDQRSRKSLEEAFGCEITDIYGSDEAGCIAWECKSCRGYHLNQDLLIVEVLKKGRPVAPGEAGEVVITNLHSYAMPFIRYVQGDIVTLSTKKPVCGCTFPLIERIEGRTDDFIHLRDGRKISPQPVYHSIDSVPGIRKWRLIQEDIDRLKLEIEPSPDYSSESKIAIRNNLQELFKLPINLELILKDKIAMEPGQKFRAVSSNLSIIQRREFF